MNEEITNIRLQFACDKNWDNMADADSGKYCHSCKKIVYDFSDAKQSEFLAIMAQNSNNICGRFGVEQLAPQPVYLPVWKKWLSAAMILIGINIFNNKVQAQTKPVTINEQRTMPDSDKVFGMVGNDPQFPGGLDALLKFLKDNIQYKKGIIDGKVILTFVIEKDGSLKDIKAIKGPSELNKSEAVRVLKLSPKWIPGDYSGKTYDVSYTVPITFKRND